MSKKQNSDFTRLEVNIPIKLKEKLLEYSKETGLNLTSALISLLNKSLY